MEEVAPEEVAPIRDIEVQIACERRLPETKQANPDRQCRSPAAQCAVVPPKRQMLGLGPRAMLPQNPRLISPRREAACVAAADAPP